MYIFSKLNCLYDIVFERPKAGILKKIPYFYLTSFLRSCSLTHFKQNIYICIINIFISCHF